MDDDDFEAPPSGRQRLLAIAALAACVLGGGWMLWERSPQPEPGAARASATGAVGAGGAPDAPVRRSTIAQAPPLEGNISLGTNLPHHGPAPVLDARRGVIRWPLTDGTQGTSATGSGEDEWIETPIPASTLSDKEGALGLPEDHRFDTQPAMLACGGKAPADLERLEAEVAALEVAVVNSLQETMDLQDTVTREADVAVLAREAAHAIRREAEMACAAMADNLGPLALYALAESKHTKKSYALDEAAAIVGSMKPKAAAKVVEGWDREFAATAMARISPRIAAPIFAAMNPEIASHVTEAILAELAFRSQRNPGVESSQ